MYRITSSIFLSIAAFFSANVAVHDASGAETSPSIRVTDENGAPLANVRGGQFVRIERDRDPNYTLSRPIDPSDADGVVRILGPADIKGPGDPIRKTDKLHYTIWLVGDTHGARMEIPHGQPFPETVALQPLVNVEIKVGGPVLPGFVPNVVPMEKTSDAIFGKTFYAHPTPVDSGENRWRVPLIDDEVYIVGWDDTTPPVFPDKMPHEQPQSRMQGYLSEPFVASEGKSIVIEPGLPSTVEYDLRDPPAGMSIFPLRVRFGRIYQDGNLETFNPGMNSLIIDEPQTVRFQYIARGRWKLAVEAWGDHSDGPDPVFDDEREILVESGQDVKLTPDYPTIDNTVDEGDLTIRGVVVNGLGEPVSNHEVWVLPWSKDPARRFGAFTPPTKTDAEGRFVLEGLSPENTYHVNTFGPDGRKTNAPIGDAAYDADGVAETRLVVEGIRDRRQPRVGQPLDDLTVQWKDGESSGLEIYKGKTVFIDVWATWCKPCIAAFPEYDALAKRHASDSSVVFLALNVDSGSETWQTFLRQHELPDVRHGWIDELKNTIRFGALPHHVVLDKDGEVIALGSDVNFEDWLPEH